MFYVYIIKSKRDDSIYIGYTDDLRRRVYEHNHKQSRTTANKIPWEIIYYEDYRAKADAKYRENNLKRFAQAYNILKRRIKNSLSARF
jgi:putative endonuclease